MAEVARLGEGHMQVHLSLFLDELEHRVSLDGYRVSELCLLDKRLDQAFGLLVISFLQGLISSDEAPSLGGSKLRVAREPLGHSKVRTFL